MTAIIYGAGAKKSGCTHFYAKSIMKVGKQCELWAGAKVELLDEGARWSLIVSAVGYTDFLKDPISGNPEAKALLPDAVFAWTPPPCIGIDWPDRGVPSLNPEWWKDLVTGLKGIDGKVGVCCIGGHGRTGTALAIIAVLAGKVKGKQCPVEWVRKRYCPEAVESSAQVEYVEWVTGRAVTASPGDELRLSAASEGGSVTAWWKGGEGSPTDPVNPTGKTVVSQAVEGTLIGSGTTGAAEARDPTDLELEQALKRGGGSVTALIEGVDNRRWKPVYDEQGEIVGWCEEGAAAAAAKSAVAERGARDA